MSSLKSERNGNKDKQPIGSWFEKFFHLDLPSSLLKNICARTIRFQVGFLHRLILAIVIHRFQDILS